MDKHLHIVMHEVPWPADFGGVVDLFYKLKALHSSGIKIHLHCFTSGRPEQDVLKQYCQSVNYYQRKKGLAGVSPFIPYIVQSRNNKDLLKNLQQDNYPILLEGIHCTYFLAQGQLKGRKVFVRLHNIEYKYYRQLARHEPHFLRKIYFKIESFLLEKYERKLSKQAIFLAVSQEDANFYSRNLHADHVEFMPVFLPWYKATSLPGKGSFCLYHGNLSVNENEKAVEWLIKEVFNELNIPLVIAGKDASPYLKALETSYPYSCLVINPSEEEMQDLIKKAQVNVLPSFNNTGVKLKLLNALFNGRHCLINTEAAEGSGMENYCAIAKSTVEFKDRLQKLFSTDFTTEDIQRREAALISIYDSKKNVEKLIAWIY